MNIGFGKKLFKPEYKNACPCSIMCDRNIPHNKILSNKLNSLGVPHE